MQMQMQARPVLLQALLQTATWLRGLLRIERSWLRFASLGSRGVRARCYFRSTRGVIDGGASSFLYGEDEGPRHCPLSRSHSAMEFMLTYTVPMAHNTKGMAHAPASAMQTWWADGFLKHVVNSPSCSRTSWAMTWRNSAPDKQVPSAFGCLYLHSLHIESDSHCDTRIDC